MLKFFNEPKDFGIWHLQELQIIGHQNDIISDGLEIDIRKLNRRKETGFQCLCGVKIAKSGIKYHGIVSNSIPEIFQSIDVAK